MKNVVLFISCKQTGQYLLLPGIDDHLPFSIGTACAEIPNFAKADLYLLSLRYRSVANFSFIPLHRPNFDELTNFIIKLSSNIFLICIFDSCNSGTCPKHVQLPCFWL